MELEQFSPADRKKIQDNPDKSPYELLELGLSQKGFEKLLSFNEEERKKLEKQEEALKPEVIEELPEKPEPRKPRLSIPQANQASGQLTVVGPSGRPRPMAARLAIRLVKEDKRYKLVDDGKRNKAE